MEGGAAVCAEVYGFGGFAEDKEVGVDIDGGGGIADLVPDEGDGLCGIKGVWTLAGKCIAQIRCRSFVDIYCTPVVPSADRRLNIISCYKIC